MNLQLQAKPIGQTDLQISPVMIVRLSASIFLLEPCVTLYPAGIHLWFATIFSVAFSNSGLAARTSSYSGKVFASAIAP